MAHRTFSPDTLRRHGVKAFALLLGSAGLAFALPAAVLALDEAPGATRLALPALLQFTPAGLDPSLARRAEAIARERGLRFTPAGAGGQAARPMTVAVRVDGDVARIVNVRGGATVVAAQPGGRTVPVAVTPARFDLGASRGYQSFAQAGPLDRLAAAPVGTARRLPVEDVPMADLAQLRRPAEPAGKPSRFSARAALQTDEGAPGRTPRTLEALGEQSVDVSGSYRVGRNLDVTAGVRLSQDRDRIAPLTDAQQDDKAVYVGTQFKF